MRKLTVIIIVVLVALTLYLGLSYVPSGTVDVSILDNFESIELYELQIYDKLGIYRSMEIDSDWNLDGYTLEVNVYWYEDGKLVEVFRPGALSDTDAMKKIALLIERDGSKGYRISSRNGASTSMDWFGNIDSNAYGMEIVKDKFNMKKDQEVVFAVHQESSKGQFLNLNSLSLEAIKKRVQETELLLLYTVKLKDNDVD